MPTVGTRASTFSKVTADSKLSTDVVAFGQKLIAEMGLELSADTPGRWMCHYLAEVIARAETAEDSERNAAEQECFRTILQLWKHRASIPSTRRPLASFDPIFQTLARLQDHTHFMFFEHAESQTDASLGMWLDLAAKVDHTARDLIDWCIANATVEAAAEDGAWATDPTARMLDDGPDMQAARLLLQNMRVLVGTEEQLAEQRAKEVVEMKNRLDEFIAACGRMRKSLESALGTRPPIRLRSVRPRKGAKVRKPQR